MPEAIILEIIRQLITHGPEIVIKIADMMDGKKDITVEDIRSCMITKLPEDYFHSTGDFK